MLIGPPRTRLLAAALALVGAVSCTAPPSSPPDVSPLQRLVASAIVDQDAEGVRIAEPMAGQRRHVDTLLAWTALARFGDIDGLPHPADDERFIRGLRTELRRGLTAPVSAAAAYLAVATLDEPDPARRVVVAEALAALNETGDEGPDRDVFTGGFLALTAVAGDVADSLGCEAAGRVSLPADLSQVVATHGGPEPACWEKPGRPVGEVGSPATLADALDIRWLLQEVVDHDGDLEPAGSDALELVREADPAWVPPALAALSGTACDGCEALGEPAVRDLERTVTQYGAAPDLVEADGFAAFASNGLVRNLDFPAGHPLAEFSWRSSLRWPGEGSAAASANVILDGLSTAAPERWADLPEAQLETAAEQAGMVGGLFRRYDDCRLVEQFGEPAVERIRDGVRGRVPPLARVGVALDLVAVERCLPEVDVPIEDVRTALLSEPALPPAMGPQDEGGMWELWSTERAACLLGDPAAGSRAASAREAAAHLDRLAEGEFATSFSVLDAFAATNIVEMSKGCDSGLDWWDAVRSG